MSGEARATYDAIVVGARVAGATTARLLAERGHRVLLLDRARFPSDTLSTHTLAYPGCLLLEQWGLLDVIAETGCPAAHQLDVCLGPTRLAVPLPEAGGLDRVYSPRRHVLDTILVRAAAASGVGVREGVRVTDLLWRAGRVVGVRGRGDDGSVLEERASVVIGADGRQSRVAQLTGARPYLEHASNNCAFYAYWTGFSAGVELHFHGNGDGEVAAFGTHDGQVVVFVSRRKGVWPQYRADPEGTYRAALREFPGMAERMAGAERVSRFHGTASFDGFFRPAAGPGWALVGDAGYHKDPTLGRGMSDALVHGWFLASELSAGLAGDRSLAASLRAFGRRRDAWSMPMYEATRALVRFDYQSSELLARLRPVLSANRVEAMVVAEELERLAVA